MKYIVIVDDDFYTWVDEYNDEQTALRKASEWKGSVKVYKVNDDSLIYHK